MRNRRIQRPTVLHLLLSIAIAAIGLLEGAAAPGQTTFWQVLAAEESLEDTRRHNLQTLNGHFPFHVPDTEEAWRERAEDLRRRVLVATGLWPLPARTSLDPVIHGKVEREGFTVERVYFESLPDHYVTGLLFRPAGASNKPRPGVLSPHGHGGRLMRYSDAELAKQIESGAEKHEGSGRTPKLARCAQLARMGCVSFIFDMVGYADSNQITFETAHRHKDARPEERQREPWCFYSAAADLRLQSIMGLQTWNALRALDFLAALPDVDDDRLAVTGGSGGGTQSILLGAIDDRLKVSFPNGMISTSMQGGCYCENCCLLRIGTGNVELAALFAPRPLGMTAADDWTRDMMVDGYPELKRLYRMLGAEDQVMCRPLLHFPHNYNYVTRSTMYEWMNRHLQLGLEEPIVEQDFEPLTDAELSVWTEQHPAPDQRGIEHERQVLAWFDARSRDQLEKVRPSDRDQLTQFHAVVGGAWKTIFDSKLPERAALDPVSIEQQEQGQIKIEKLILRHDRRGAALPIVVLSPKEQEVARTIVWTGRLGKAEAFDSDGTVSPALEFLLQAGARVVLVDLYEQGELIDSDTTSHLQVRIDDRREYSAFTFGYNETLVAERVADLLTVIAYARSDSERPLCLLGTDGTATWALPAAMLAGPSVTRAALDTDGFRFTEVSHFSDPRFVPGALKYGGVPALLALRAPYPMLIVGEGGELPELAGQAYHVLDADEEITSRTGSVLDHGALTWLAQ